MKSKQNADQSSLEGPWSTFSLGDERFAIRAADVQEVMMEQPLTPVPLAPVHIVGLLNLRGQVMPAIDLRRRLNFASRPQGAGCAFLVLKTDEQLISIVVDAIGDVIEIEPDSWEPLPETLQGQHRQCIFGISPTNPGVILGVRVNSITSEEEGNTAGAKA